MTPLTMYDKQDTQRVDDVSLIEDVVSEKEPASPSLKADDAAFFQEKEQYALGTGTPINTLAEAKDFIDVAAEIAPYDMSAEVLGAIETGIPQGGLTPEEVDTKLDTLSKKILVDNSGKTLWATSANEKEVVSLAKEMEDTFMTLRTSDGIPTEEAVEQLEELNKLTSTAKNGFTDVSTKMDLLRNARIQAENIVNQKGMGPLLLHAVKAGTTYYDTYQEVSMSAVLEDLGVEDSWFLAANAYKLKQFCIEKAADSTVSPAKFQEFIDVVNSRLTKEGFTPYNIATFWQEALDPAYVSNVVSQAWDTGEAIAFAVSLGTSGLLTQPVKTLSKGSAEVLKKLGKQVVKLNGAADIATSAGAKAIAVGKNRKLVKAVSEALLKGDEGFKDPKLFDFANKVFQSNVDPRQLKDTISATGALATNKAIEDTAEALSVAKQLQQKSTVAQALSRDVQKGLEEAAKGFFKEITGDTFSPKYLADITETTKDASGTFSITLKIGKQVNNEGFSSAASALEVAKARKIKDFDIVYEGANGYFIKAYKKVGNSSNLVEVGKDLVEQGQGPLSEVAKGSYISTILSVDKNSRAINLLASKELNRLQEFVKSARQGIANLDPERAKQLNYLLRKSRSTEIWANTDVLRAKGVDEAVVSSYEQIRKLRDIEYLVSAAERSEKLAASGAKVLAKADGNLSGIGRVIRPKAIEVSTTSFRKGDEVISLTQEGFDTLIEKGWTPFKKMQSHGEIILLPPGTALEELNSLVGSYLAGPSAKYSSKLKYVKQVHMVKENDRVILKGITPISADFPDSHLAPFVKQLEDLRFALAKKAEGLEDVSDSTIKALITSDIEDTLGFSTEKAAKTWFEAHDISLVPEATIEVVSDGEPLASYTKAAQAPYKYTDYVKEQAHAFEHSDARAMERGEYIERLQRERTPLYTIEGKKAAMVDYVEETQKTLNKIATTLGVDVWEEQYATNYFNLYKEYIPAGMSPKQALRTGTTLAPTNSAVYGKMQNARRAWLNIRGEPSGLDIWYHTKRKAFIGYIAEKLGVNIDNIMTQRAIDKMDPVTLAKRITFEYAMGFFNLGQLPTQAAAVANSLAISPRAASKAMGLLPMLAASVYKSDKASNKLLAKVAEKVLGIKMSPKDASNLIEDLKVILSKDSFYGGLGELSRSGGKLLNISHLPFNMGEGTNRIHAATTALLEYYANKGKTFGSLKDASVSTLTNLNVRTESLYMNMSKGSASAAQTTSLTSMLTTFKGYTLKVLEAMFDKQLTRAEKIRLVTTPIILGGSRALIGNKYAANLYGYMLNHEVDPMTASVVTNGLINSLGDPQGDAPDVTKLFDYPLTSLLTEGLDNLAVVTNISKLVGLSSDVVGGVCNVLKGDISSSDFMSLIERSLIEKNAPTSFNNMYRGYSLMKAGKYLNKQGALTAEASDRTMAALSSMFGLNTRKEVDTFMIKMAQASQDEKISLLTDELVKTLNAGIATDNFNGSLDMCHMIAISKDFNEQETRRIISIAIKRSLQNTAEPERKRIISKMFLKANPLSKGRK